MDDEPKEGRAMVSAPSGALEMSATLLSFLRTAVVNPDVDAAKVKALLEVQYMVLDRQAIEDFDQAKARLPRFRVKKNGTIELGKDKEGKQRSVAFATWEDMDDVIRPALEKEGFSLSFDSTPRPGDGGGLIVTGRLSHINGHSKTASIPLPLDAGPGRNSLQAMGSSLSYGKRYTAEMLLNIVREGVDDDGKTGGMKFLDEDQQAELIELIKETKTDPAGFFALLCGPEVRSYTEIESRDFVRLKNALNVKKTQKKGGA